MALLVVLRNLIIITVRITKTQLQVPNQILIYQVGIIRNKLN